MYQSYNLFTQFPLDWLTSSYLLHPLDGDLEAPRNAWAGMSTLRISLGTFWHTVLKKPNSRNQRKSQTLWGAFLQPGGQNCERRVSESLSFKSKIESIVKTMDCSPPSMQAKRPNPKGNNKQSGSRCIAAGWTLHQCGVGIFNAYVICMICSNAPKRNKLNVHTRGANSFEVH